MGVDPPSTREFYDGLPGEYHHLFGIWDEAVRRQGGALNGLSHRRAGRIGGSPASL